MNYAPLRLRVMNNNRAWKFLSWETDNTVNCAFDLREVEGEGEEGRTGPRWMAAEGDLRCRNFEYYRGNVKLWTVKSKVEVYLMMSLINDKQIL